MKKRHTTNFEEIIISRALQIGVAISSAFIIAGLGIFLSRLNEAGQNSAQSYRYYTGAGFSFPHTIPAILTALGNHSGLGLIVLGCLLMILTPSLRVATTICLFASKRDKPMLKVTLTVLSILIGSFVVGVLVH